MPDRLLKEKLGKIDSCIKLMCENEKDIGLFSGLSGISLFKFYYSKLLNDHSDQNLGKELLTECIKKINEGYNNPTFVNGIAGFGWTLDHLEQEGFIETENDELLTAFDSHIYAFMLHSFENRNYDFLHGGIGYAYYFLNRYRNTRQPELKIKYEKILLESVFLLEKISEKEENEKIKWHSISPPPSSKKGYNLGLSHGIAGIIGFLTKLHKYEAFKPTVKTLLRGATNYIISFKNHNPKAFSLFPGWAPKDGETPGKSRLGWCYGDLGIGYILYNAAKELNDKKLESTALSTLKHAAKRRSFENTWVEDAAICHGSFGNALVFKRVYEKTSNLTFKTAAEFWFQDGLKRNLLTNTNRGNNKLKTNINQPVDNISLIQGISGIGLVIIDYLSNFKCSWDECLMMN